MKNTSCIMASASGVGQVTVGVAYSPNQHSLLCTISNWSLPAGVYSFQFPGLMHTKNLTVTMFPSYPDFLSLLLTSNHSHLKFLVAAFVVGSIRNVSFVSLTSSVNHSCSLSFMSSTAYRCAFSDAHLAPGPDLVTVYVQESEFEREFILGQYVVEMTNRPPVFISDGIVVLPPSTYVLDENSLAQFSSTFSVVSPGRSYEMNQSMTAISHVSQTFGIQFIQSPFVYIDHVSSRLVMNFSTVKEFQVGNFTVIIRITDDGGFLNMEA